MEVQTTLEGLQTLQQDLIALLDSRLHNLERLDQALQLQITDFRQLLDRKRRNEESRKALRDAPKVKGQPEASEVTINGADYAISEDFKNAAFTVADEVDLDELDAAKLCLAVQNEVDIVDETLPYRAILRFHNERQLKLECLRLILKRVAEGDKTDEDNIYDFFQEYVRSIAGSNSGSESAFWTKCCACLTEMEELIAKTQAQLQAMAMTGSTTRGARGEALQAQRMYVTHEHESLASIMCYLIRTENISLADYRRLLIKAAGTDAPFDVISHLAPPIIAGATHFGAGSTVEDSQAQDIYRLLAPGPTQQAWKNPELHAATTIWWLVEYSARHSDVVPSAIGSKDKSQDATDRHELFFQCLEKKGFHYMLAIADFLKPEVWHDPAKAGLVRFLLDDTSRVPAEAVAPANDFAYLTMEEFQNFTEAFVSYMPDVLRQLKTEEDDKRRNQLRDDEPYYDMHLERFLLIVAYAYQDDTEAAMEFWNDTESNLYGFLRWTSTRLPTPRAAAFCELMRALSNDERTADHAHRFLLEEKTTIGGRLRKGHAVSWAQIFSTLDVYASSVQQQIALVGTVSQRGSVNPDLLETETPIMLEAYLRLITHILRHSHLARHWVLREQPFRLHETLLSLAQCNIGPIVQACCFSVLTALLTDKTSDINDGLWLALDNWVSSGANQSNVRNKAAVSEKQYLNAYAANAEVAEALTHLLIVLVAPVAGAADVVLDALPFPEAMVTSHRRPGMDVYVDFVLSQAFVASGDPATAGDRMQMSVLRHACLTFVAVCLSTFNEDLILLAQNQLLGTEAAALQKSSDNYIKLHPFARVFEYLFNDKVITILMEAAQQGPDELETLGPHSPLVQATVKAVEVMSLALEKQSTYFNIVRPAIKTLTARQRTTVANPAIASFDDVITMNLDLALYLANYPACRHMDLTLASMKLLQQMSSSRKITGSLEGGSLHDGQRLISKLENESEALQVELRQNFIFTNLRELEVDINPVTFEKAKAILALLQASLDTSPETPNIAHALLGFTCEKNGVKEGSGTLFAEAKSLFHHIAEAAVTLQPCLGTQHMALLHAVRSGCIQLLTSLASARLTGPLVLQELRNVQYLAALVATSAPIAQQSLWEGVQADDSTLWFDAGSQALLDFLREREYALDYAVKELQSVLKLDIVSIRQKTVSILAGDGAALGDDTPFMSVFDMIDFFDLNISTPLVAVVKHLDVDQRTLPAGADTRWDVKAIQQLLTLKKRELWHSGLIKDQADELAVNDEISANLHMFESQNQYFKVQEARLDTLESWTDVVSALVQTQDGTKFAYQALQLVVPRLDKAFRDDIPAAEQLAKLALVLARTISASKSQLSSAVQDHLLQIFRISTRATIDSETTLALRDICYRMSCTVISTILLHGKQTNTTHRQQIVQHVRDIGDRIVRVLSEDAFSDRGVTRVSSLLFLDSILQLSSFGQSSAVILRSLTKVNFIPVLIDSSIGSVASTFSTPDVDLQSSLAYFHSAASLLLRITQIADGPQLVLQSNFISAVEESGLFSTDPDIGLDIDNPEALDAYYQLLSALTRILVAIVVRRGSGDGSVIQTARRFLQDNRTSVSAVFKLASRQGIRTNPKALEVADELSRLMFVTGFMDNDEAHTHKTNGYRFT